MDNCLNLHCPKLWNFGKSNTSAYSEKFFFMSMNLISLIVSKNLEMEFAIK